MKRLVFAAILATVAVGSAFAVDYSTSPNGAGTKFNCTAASGTPCQSYNGGIGYQLPNSTTPVPLPSGFVRIL